MVFKQKSSLDLEPANILGSSHKENTVWGGGGNLSLCPINDKHGSRFKDKNKPSLKSQNSM